MKITNSTNILSFYVAKNMFMTHTCGLAILPEIISEFCVYSLKLSVLQIHHYNCDSSIYYTLSCPYLKTRRLKD
jgi:hypothetical protein